jgi:hypothetical protein
MRNWAAVTLALVVAFKPVPLVASPTPEAEAYFREALNILERFHVNRGGVDWLSINAKAQEQMRNAKTSVDTYPAIRWVLGALGEKHSFLLEASAVADPMDGVAGRADGKLAAFPTWRFMADRRIGVVQLPELNTVGSKGHETGRLYAASLRDALASLDKGPLCGWIVDLRQNGGGNMWPMLQGLDPLLGDEPFGYFVRPTGVAVTWVRTPSGITAALESPSRRRPAVSLVHQRAPVAVLIGAGTASSGEMTAIALIGRPGVRTFGAPSAGYTSANSVYPLSDGAALVVTVTRVRDRSGKDYVGPIEPDQKVQPHEAERAASDWLRSKC